jgi:hypothetical protein
MAVAREICGHGLELSAVTALQTTIHTMNIRAYIRAYTHIHTHTHVVQEDFSDDDGGQQVCPQSSPPHTLLPPHSTKIHPHHPPPILSSYSVLLSTMSTNRRHLQSKSQSQRKRIQASRGKVASELEHFRRLPTSRRGGLTKEPRLHACNTHTHRYTQCDIAPFHLFSSNTICKRAILTPPHLLPPPHRSGRSQSSSEPSSQQGSRESGLGGIMGGEHQ